MKCSPKEVPKFPSYWIPNAKVGNELSLASSKNARTIFQFLLKKNTESVRIVALSLGLPTFNYIDGTNKELTLPMGVEQDIFKVFDEERKISPKDVKVIAWLEGVFIGNKKNPIVKQSQATTPENSPIIGTDIQYRTGNLLLDPLNSQVQDQLISMVQSLGSRNDINAIELDDHFSILPEDQEDPNKFIKFLAQVLVKGIRFLNKQIKNVIARPPQRTAGKSLKWRDERITPTREIKQQRNT